LGLRKEPSVADERAEAPEGAEAEPVVGQESGEIEAPKPPVVRYAQQAFSDSEGRAIVQVTPLGGAGKPQYKVQMHFQKGPAHGQVVYEIEATSPDEAFDRYDARLAEEQAKFEAKVGQAALIVPSHPNIEQYRQQKMGRQQQKRRIGGNGGRRFLAP